MTLDNSEHYTDESQGSRGSEVADEVSSELPYPGVLELERVFSVLAHPRRRSIVYLLDEDAEWTLRELTTKIAAWELGCTEDAVDDHTRDRVYLSLLHNHIPRLEEHNVVVFDQETDRLQKAAHAQQVVTALKGAFSSLNDELI